MQPSVDQLLDWRSQLSRLAGEMERVYGEPGQNNQDTLDASVHVAFYVACVKCTERGIA